MPELIAILENFKREVIHKDCGAHISFFQNEIKDGGVHQDYGGGSEKLYYINCPNCHEKVYVDMYDGNKKTHPIIPVR